MTNLIKLISLILCFTFLNQNVYCEIVESGLVFPNKKAIKDEKLSGELSRDDINIISNDTFKATDLETPKVKIIDLPKDNESINFSGLSKELKKETISGKVLDPISNRVPVNSEATKVSSDVTDLLPTSNPNSEDLLPELEDDEDDFEDQEVAKQINELTKENSIYNDPIYSNSQPLSQQPSYEQQAQTNTEESPVSNNLNYAKKEQTSNKNKFKGEASFTYDDNSYDSTNPTNDLIGDLNEKSRIKNNFKGEASFNYDDSSFNPTNPKLMIKQKPQSNNEFITENYQVEELNNEHSNDQLNYDQNPSKEATNYDQSPSKEATNSMSIPTYLPPPLKDEYDIYNEEQSTAIYNDKLSINSESPEVPDYIEKTKDLTDKLGYQDANLTDEEEDEIKKDIEFADSSKLDIHGSSDNEEDEENLAYPSIYKLFKLKMIKLKQQSKVNNNPVVSEQAILTPTRSNARTMNKIKNPSAKFVVSKLSDPFPTTDLFRRRCSIKINSLTAIGLCRASCGPKEVGIQLKFKETCSIHQITCDSPFELCCISNLSEQGACDVDLFKANDILMNVERSLNLPQNSLIKLSHLQPAFLESIINYRPSTPVFYRTQQINPFQDGSNFLRIGEVPRPSILHVKQRNTTISADKELRSLKDDDQIAYSSDSKFKTISNQPILKQSQLRFAKVLRKVENPKPHTRAVYHHVPHDQIIFY